MIIFIIIYLQITYVLLQKKLIWISINGISPRHINNNTMPFLQKMKKYGAFCNNLESNFVANDYSTTYSMSTGFYPQHHGILFEEMLKNNHKKWFSKTKLLKEWWYNKNYTILPIWITNYLNYQKGPVLCIDWPGCNVDYKSQLINNNIYPIYPIYLPGDSMINSNSRISIALQYTTIFKKSNLILLHLTEIIDIFMTKYQNETKILEKVKFHDELLETFFNNLDKLNILKQVFN